MKNHPNKMMAMEININNNHHHLNSEEVNSSSHLFCNLDGESCSIEDLEFKTTGMTFIHDLNKYQMLINTLAGQQTAFAIFETNKQIYFQNDYFGKIFFLNINDKRRKILLNKLGTWLLKFFAKFYSQISLTNTCQTAYLQLDQEIHELIVSRININGESDDFLLIQLKSDPETYSQANSYITRIGLTKREKEVSLMVKSGMSDDEISSQLYISPCTVRNHLSSIYQKLHVNRRSKMIAILNKQ